MYRRWSPVGTEECVKCMGSGHAMLSCSLGGAEKRTLTADLGHKVRTVFESGRLQRTQARGHMRQDSGISARFHQNLNFKNFIINFDQNTSQTQNLNYINPRLPKLSLQIKSKLKIKIKT